MKNLILLTLFCTAALPGSLPLRAAAQAADVAEAQAKGLINDDGYIFFAYADGWDKYSRKLCEELMASEAIRKAAGKAVLLPWPVPEYTTEESKKAADARRGNLNIPGANSYPALLLLDSKGQHYATLSGHTINRGTQAEIARLLRDRMLKGKKRAALLAKAETRQGPARAALLAQAYGIDGLTRPANNFTQQLTALDPRDESGAVRARKFSPYDFGQKLDKEEVKQAIALVEEVLSDKAYSDRQKQQVCAALLGTLRRRAKHAEAANIQRYAKLMEQYAPETALGKAAAWVAREWRPAPLLYSEGWTPSSLPTDKTPVELEGKLPISGPGTYTVTFQYTGGTEALVVDAVELYDGRSRSAEDRHRGSAGHRHSNNTYTLKVGSAVRNPRIVITVDMPKNDSYGKVVIEKK